MDYFTRLECVGMGSFGKVFKAIDKRSGFLCVLKICNVTPDDMAELLTEALILRQINHPNVIGCEDIFFEKNRIVFKLELMKQSLWALQEKTVFTSKDVRMYFTQLVKGLHYLHQKDITHCDLKPSNILCNGEVMKIADFNSAQVGKIHDTPGTTLWYRAPEAVLEKKYLKSCDVWSLGCIMYEMITNRVLFPAEDEKELIVMIVNRFGIPKNYEPMNCISFAGQSRGLTRISDPMELDVLEKMLQIRPDDRITMEQLLEHPYCSLVDK